MSRLLRDVPAQTPAMLATFGDAALVRAALAFEAALAAVQAECGVIPEAHAAAIGAACEALDPDIEALAAAAAHAGTLAIPLIRLLRDAVASRDPTAAASVHRGATSQDLADTALVLQAGRGMALLRTELGRIHPALARLAAEHAATPALGRTLLQPARPITLGLRFTQWRLGIRDAEARLETEAARALVLQFGGVVGARHDQDGRGEPVSTRLAARLGLPPSPPWHARRANLAGLGAACAILTGAAAKMARDITLSAQPELGEMSEPSAAGRGGSSAVPGKRNQTLCQVALSAAVRVHGLAASLIAGLPQEFERGIGGWQAEAPVLADLFGLAHAALRAIAETAEDLHIDTEAARRALASMDEADIGESASLARVI